MSDKAEQLEGIQEKEGRDNPDPPILEEDLEGWRYFSEALKSWILVLISLSTSVRADIISNLGLLPKK